MLFFLCQFLQFYFTVPSCLCLNPDTAESCFNEANLCNVFCPAWHPTKTGDDCNLLRRPRLPLNCANHKTQWSEWAKLYILQLDQKKYINGQSSVPCWVWQLRITNEHLIIFQCFYSEKSFCMTTSRLFAVQSKWCWAIHSSSILCLPLIEMWSNISVIYCSEISKDKSAETWKI